MRKAFQYRLCPTKSQAAELQWRLDRCRELYNAALPPSSGPAIGLDLGLESFATLSDGTRIENPRHFRQGQAVLAKRQRALARKRRGSKRRAKARMLVAKAHVEHE